MEPPPPPSSRRFRIRVQIYEPADAYNLNATPSYQFTIVKAPTLNLPEITLQTLCDLVKDRFRAIYPGQSLFKIEKPQDVSGSDLYLEDRVQDIFEDNEIFRVIRGESVRASVDIQRARSRSVQPSGFLRASFIGNGGSGNWKRCLNESEEEGVGRLGKRPRVSGRDPDRPLRSSEHDAVPLELQDTRNQAAFTPIKENSQSRTSHHANGRGIADRGSALQAGTYESSQDYGTHSLDRPSSGQVTLATAEFQRIIPSTSSASRDEGMTNGLERRPQQPTSMSNLQVSHSFIQQPVERQRGLSISTAVTTPPSTNAQSPINKSKKLKRPSLKPKMKKHEARQISTPRPRNYVYDVFDTDDERSSRNRMQRSISSNIDDAPGSLGGPMAKSRSSKPPLNAKSSLDHCQATSMDRQEQKVRGLEEQDGAEDQEAEMTRKRAEAEQSRLAAEAAENRRLEDERRENERQAQLQRELKAIEKLKLKEKMAAEEASRQKEAEETARAKRLEEEKVSKEVEREVIKRKEAERVSKLEAQRKAEDEAKARDELAANEKVRKAHEARLKKAVEIEAKRRREDEAKAEKEALAIKANEKRIQDEEAKARRKADKVAEVVEKDRRERVENARKAAEARAERDRAEKAEHDRLASQELRLERLQRGTQPKVLVDGEPDDVSDKHEANADSTAAANLEASYEPSDVDATSLHQLEQLQGEVDYTAHDEESALKEQQLVQSHQENRMKSEAVRALLKESILRSGSLVERAAEAVNYERLTRAHTVVGVSSQPPDATSSLPSNKHNTCTPFIPKGKARGVTTLSQLSSQVVAGSSQEAPIFDVGIEAQMPLPPLFHRNISSEKITTSSRHRSSSATKSFKQSPLTQTTLVPARLGFTDKKSTTKRPVRNAAKVNVATAKNAKGKAKVVESPGKPPSPMVVISDDEQSNLYPSDSEYYDDNVQIIGRSGRAYSPPSQDAESPSMGYSQSKLDSTAVEVNATAKGQDATHSSPKMVHKERRVQPMTPSPSQRLASQLATVPTQEPLQSIKSVASKRGSMLRDKAHFQERPSTPIHISQVAKTPSTNLPVSSPGSRESSPDDSTSSSENATSPPNQSRTSIDMQAQLDEQLLTQTAEILKSASHSSDGGSSVSTESIPSLLRGKSKLPSPVREPKQDMRNKKPSLRRMTEKKKLTQEADLEAARDRGLAKAKKLEDVAQSSNLPASSEAESLSDSGSSSSEDELPQSKNHKSDKKQRTPIFGKLAKVFTKPNVSRR